MQLAAQQKEAFEKIMAFMATDDKNFTLAGYAGTGKTTLAKYIGKEFGSVYNLAFTGKAANVLREKGVRNASTIHGMAYKLIEEDKHGTPYFDLDLESPLTTADCVIVDEYSMLPKEIIDDIEKLAKKVIYMGDPFQLPPVQGTCSLSPDFFLTEIHRQALDSPILRYATDVREGREIKFCDLPEFKYGPRSAFCADDYDEAEQVIVGYNKTRKLFNNRFREKLGFAGQELPCRGDKMICLKNNHKMGLFNGMIADAESDCVRVSFEELRIDCFGHKKLKLWDGPFRDRERCIGRSKTFEQADFGYAITCHKAQGSEFDNVLIFNQPIGTNHEERRRWIYTAITRGKHAVKLVQP